MRCSPASMVARLGVLSLFFLLIPPAPLQAQPLTIRVLSGPVTLQLNPLSAGTGTSEADDNSTRLRWMGGGDTPSKITVSAVCPGQSFSLYAVAEVDKGQAVAHPEVALVDGMMPVDFLSGIPPQGPGSRNGQGNVRFRATASAAQGNSLEQGDDVYTITFTLTAQ